MAEKTGSKKVMSLPTLDPARLNAWRSPSTKVVTAQIPSDDLPFSAPPARSEA